MNLARENMKCHYLVFTIYYNSANRLYLIHSQTSQTLTLIHTDLTSYLLILSFLLKSSPCSYLQSFRLLLHTLTKCLIITGTSSSNSPHSANLSVFNRPRNLHSLPFPEHFTPVSFIPIFISFIIPSMDTLKSPNGQGPSLSSITVNSNKTRSNPLLFLHRLNY